MAIVIDQFVDNLEHINNPGMLVEAFIRGAAGNSSGTAAKVLDRGSKRR
jgi:hypothetical protein